MFVDPGVKVNRQYYRDVLLSHQMIPAIKQVAGDMFVFQQDSAPAHRARDTIQLLQRDAWLHWSWPLAAQQSRPESRRLQDLGRHATAGVWIMRQQRWWAEGTSPRRLAWCAAGHHCLGCQPVETATESVRACTWETFWTFVVSLCNTNLRWKPIRANKLLLNIVY